MRTDLKRLWAEAERRAATADLRRIAGTLLTIQASPQPVGELDSAATVALAQAYVEMNLNADALTVAVGAMRGSPRVREAITFVMRGIWEGKFHARDPMA